MSAAITASVVPAFASLRLPIGHSAWLPGCLATKAHSPACEHESTTACALPVVGLLSDVALAMMLLWRWTPLMRAGRAVGRVHGISLTWHPR